jgi:predicted HicB family RNase H-like nuclease
MTKPPYDPDKLPPDLQKLIPQDYRRPLPKKTYVVTPSSMVTPRCQTTPVKQKSYAQVESLVSPPNSGGLKPMRRKRRNPLTVRLSDSDRENIKQKAEAAGCTLNAYVRASLLGSDYKAPKDPELVQAFLKLNLELTRQGVNFNQIAKQLNAGVLAPAQGETMFTVLARSTLQIHKAIRQAMAKGEMGEE